MALTVGGLLFAFYGGSRMSFISPGEVSSQHTGAAFAGLKDAAAWGRTVTQMRAWGTAIQDEDQTALVAYLVQHFGPGGRR